VSEADTGPRRLVITDEPVEIVTMRPEQSFTANLKLSNTAKPIAARITAKIARGERLVQEFAQGARDWYRKPPWTISAYEDAERNRRSFVLSRLDPVPVELETIAADALGNFREALDNIAFQLELQAAGKKPAHNVYFPIAGNAAAYPAHRDNCLRHVGADVKAAIDAMEPYRDGAGHALWQLNKLKNTDKHHLLVMTGLSNQGVDVSSAVRAAVGNTDPELAGQIGPLFVREVGAEHVKVGTELYAEPLDVDLQEQRRLLMALSFDRPDVIDPDTRATTALNRFGMASFDVAIRLLEFLR
jgi:hypothetical protein